MGTYLPPRYKAYVCHLCTSNDEACQMTGKLIDKVLSNTKNYLQSGKLTEKAQQEKRLLELTVHDQLKFVYELKPTLRENTIEFRRRFRKWSNVRSEVINELTVFIGQVVKVKTGTNVVKAAGHVTSILSGILAIGGVILAPETGGLSLSAWGIRAQLASRFLFMGAEITDGVFSHIQSKRVVELIEKDRKVTEQMEEAVESLMTTSKVFADAVGEFQKRYESFDFQEITEEVKELQCQKAQAKTSLDIVEKALKTGLVKSSSAVVKGMTGFLIGIYVIMDTVELSKTIKDIQDGSRSDLQEHIVALTAVLIREKEILEKQFNNMA